MIKQGKCVYFNSGNFEMGVRHQESDAKIGQIISQSLGDLGKVCQFHNIICYTFSILEHLWTFNPLSIILSLLDSVAVGWVHHLVSRLHWLILIHVLCTK